MASVQMQRNPLQEFAAKAEAEQTCQPKSCMRKRPRSPEPTVGMAVESSIVGPAIGVVPFVVIVSDGQNDEAIAHGDEDVLIALSTIAGTYWPVHGIEVGGRQVWKQA